MSAGRAYDWIHRVWYEDAPGGWLLWPLEWLYRALVALRGRLYARGLLRTWPVGVPVVVVGNLSAGGTGKTPVVLWLAAELRKRGLRPGIVSRGYGGSAGATSMRVDADSDASVAGDEPVLLARRSGCPVVVDADRVRAARMLVADGVDVVLADDGLQHYRLERDFEICVIDGARGFGNGHLLPAGPLREAHSRLASVDRVLVNGTTDAAGNFAGSQAFELRASGAQRLNGSSSRALAELAGRRVHAVAGIGNPDRFFALLRSQGLELIEHPFVDHAALTLADLEFNDDLDVFMTEKDAVKLGSRVGDRFWFVPVELHMDETQAASLVEELVGRLRQGAQRQQTNGS